MSRTTYLFYGTPEFALPVLDAFENADRRPLAVVCQPDRPAGRGRRWSAGPVKRWAQRRSIEVLQPNRQQEPETVERIRQLAPDLCLVASFGQILPEVVLNIPRLGFINVHPSLIPRYRGAAPIQWTLINGDAQSGVTILKVTPRLDEGDVLAQAAVEVGPDETAEQLSKRLGKLGGELALRVVEHFEAGRTEGVPQDERQVVWAPSLGKRDGWIDWRHSARSIHNRIRGVQPWPGARTTLAAKTLKIHRAAVSAADAAGNARPGEVIQAEGDRLLVQTGDGVLRLLEIQLEGKKRLQARAFLAGRKIRMGDVLVQPDAVSLSAAEA